jgi:hypothetical protein
MSTEFIIEKITKKDLPEIRTLALNNGGNQRLTESFIENWYLNNPSNSASLCKVVGPDGHIEGYATTNNFNFTIEGKSTLVAMPQNVLTSLKVRGKGLFNKLYFKTESDNLTENKVECFLTFTNKLSTPIFLNKFSYERGKCPDVVFTSFNFLDLFSSYHFIRMPSIDEILINSRFEYDNSMNKDLAYFKWRYKLYSKDDLHIVAVKKATNNIGYVFLKVIKKHGVKCLLLMDIISDNATNLSAIIEASFSYAAKNGFIGVVMFDGAFSVKKRMARIKLKNRLNFLVKGQTTDTTKHLSQLDFNFFFGDLDIV